MIAHASHGVGRRGDCILEVMDCCLGIEVDRLNPVQAGFGQCTGTNSVHRGGVITLATVHAVQQSLLHQRSVYGRYHYHAII